MSSKLYLDSNNHRQYRADIDGMRAIAVMAVVIFHMFPDLLRGGFIGVDIFFIISGYLISSIILQDLNNSTFKFSDFYIRRIKRIFPALFVIFIFIILIGYFILLPYEFVALGKNIRFATIFMANIFNYRDINYFDTNANFKPLLHLWSLSVEEQFYILFPLFMFVVYRLRNFMLPLIIMAILLSFAANIFYVNKQASVSFYYLATRAWELLLGTLLAYLTLKPMKYQANRNYISIVGITCILIAAVTFETKSRFPGWLALIPTLGTCCLIYAQSSWFNRKILSNSMLVSIGLISYPLYLWHWPLISFARIMQGGEVQVSSRVIIILVSLTLAAATTYLIERPIRKLGPKIFYLLVFLMFIIGGVAVKIKNGNLHPRSINLDHKISQINFAINDWGHSNETFEEVGTKDFPIRAYGKGKDKIVFFGDSNAEQYWPRIQKLMQESSQKYNKYTTVFASWASTLPVPKVESYNDINQSIFVNKAVEYIQSPEVKTVVFAAAWVGYSSLKDKGLIEFENLLAKLRQQEKKVYIILNIPMNENQDPKKMFKRHLFSQWEFVTDLRIDSTRWLAQAEDLRENLKRIANSTGTIIIDPVDYLCTNNQCLVLRGDGVYCYKDIGHLSATYVRDNITFVDQILE